MLEYCGTHTGIPIQYYMHAENEPTEFRIK